MTKSDVSAPHDLQADIDAVGRIAAVPTILDVVCRVTGMRFAVVARVTENRWVACKVLDNIDFGMTSGGELETETTICHEVRESGKPVIINNVAEDEAFCGHPTPAMYGFQSYISMPIVLRDGRFFGTLCALDPRPARLKNPETIGMFKLFAELIASHLDADDKLKTSQTELAQERELAELREQFIAVLGHDLRNPVASIDAGARMLLRTPQSEKGKSIIALMQGSVMRMRGLIDNVLDFARARLGDGLNLEIDSDEPLQPVLEQVVSELKSIQPDRKIKVDFALTEPVAADPGRIAQLLSNLLANALTHGADNAPVTVGARTQNGKFELWVSNAGAPIAPEVLDNLFKPFFRQRVRTSQQGLGLGLYIASEIARAHGGALEVNSGPEETRFTLSMPLKIVERKP